MGSILSAFFTFLLIVVSLFMIFLILLQRASTSGGLGTAFGGGMAESTFGADAGGMLKKLTFGAAVAFFVLSFGLYLGYISGVGGPQVEEGTLPASIFSEEPVTTFPAPTGELENQLSSPFLEPSLDLETLQMRDTEEAGDSDSDADAPEKP